MMKPTEQQFLSYQKIFNYFNERLFENKLPDVILNFSRLKNSHGFFAPERWVDGDKAKSHEISLNPQTLGRNPKEVLATLVHEMVHLWQQEYGKPSRSAYHNKEWAKKMVSVGLIPSDTGEPGGKQTGQAMTHYVKKEGAFDIAFQEMEKELILPFTSTEYRGTGAAKTTTGEEEAEGEESEEEEETQEDKKKKRKYSCPVCEINVWGKPDLNLHCNDCKQDMQENN